MNDGHRPLATAELRKYDTTQTNLPLELLEKQLGGMKMAEETYTGIMQAMGDGVASPSARDLAIMAEVILKSSRMTAGLVRKLRQAGEAIPPDVARWELDRLADAPENYDPFEEIRLEYACPDAITG